MHIALIIISILLLLAVTAYIFTLSAVRKKSENLNGEIRTLTEENTALKLENAAVTSELRSKNELLREQKEQEEKNEQRFKTVFENIAAEILEKKSERFNKENSTQIKSILEPLEKDIARFKEAIEKNYVNETREKASLSKELQQLMELNRQLSSDADNLTKALKGEKNNKMQGDWGEMILDTILSNSGLKKDEHYFCQESSRDENGNIIRPDVIVRYPDGSEVIIDSKVSLSAYSRFVAAEDEDERSAALGDHIASVRRHITQLSEKRYENREKSLDFVMMFMPIEPAYMAALGTDNSLWEYAYGRKILLVSPTHLITALKLIYDLWKRDAQTKNTIAIAEQGAKLYDKFAGFVDDLEKIGANLDRTSKSYGDAMTKLRDGNGNLIRQAEQLKKLGVKTKKQLNIGAGEEDEPSPDSL